MTTAKITAKKKLKKKAANRSVRKTRRAAVAKLIHRIDAGDERDAEILMSAHQAMFLLDEEESVNRRELWTQRLKDAVAPALVKILNKAPDGTKLAASHVVAKLVDAPGEHALKGKRYEYGKMVLETLGTLRLGKIQADVATGPDYEITSEVWLRALADLRPLFEEVITKRLEQHAKEAHA